MNPTYYIRSNGKIYGPIPQEKIGKGIVAGLFSINDEISRDRLSWSSLRQWPFFSSAPEAPAEEPAEKPAEESAPEVDLQDETPLPENIPVQNPSSGKIHFEPVKEAFPRDPSRAGIRLGIAVLILAFLGIAGSRIASIWKQDSATALSEAAERHRHDVALVALELESGNGKKVRCAIGTAWADSPYTFVTNAHVALDLKNGVAECRKYVAQMLLREKLKPFGIASIEEFAKKNGEAAAINLQRQVELESKKFLNRAEILLLPNGKVRTEYPVSHVQIHKGYDVVGSKFKPDLAIFTITRKNDSFFKIAPLDRLYSTKSGDPVAFLGFPMENMNNVDQENPVATMQSGIIVAATDFDLKDAGPALNQHLRHNLPAAGGASGSPIFNPKGEVVGVLWGGSITWHQGKDGRMESVPSAALINYAVRADLLRDMGPRIPVAEFLK